MPSCTLSPGKGLGLGLKDTQTCPTVLVGGVEPMTLFLPLLPLRSEVGPHDLLQKARDPVWHPPGAW